MIQPPVKEAPNHFVINAHGIYSTCCCLQLPSKTQKNKGDAYMCLLPGILTCHCGFTLTLTEHLTCLPMQDRTYILILQKQKSLHVFAISFLIGN